MNKNQIPPEAIEAAFGRIETNARVYAPLDMVFVTLIGRALGDTSAHIRVCDPEQKLYAEFEVKLENNRGQVCFPAKGALGNHYVYLTWPGESKHSRYINFRLDAQTKVESGDIDFDGLIPFTRDAMLLGRREYETPSGRFVGYISADTLNFDGIWLRDWIYGLSACRHWEMDMKCGLDRFLERQTESGMMPDGIKRDGRAWRVGLESDVEYIIVIGVYQIWEATGDDAWMAATLPKLEKALAFIRSDPKHWDAEHELVKRQHSCDTWDFDIDGIGQSGETRHVIATCDQSGYVLAFMLMAKMYGHLGQEDAGARWADEAKAYRERANRLLWDGGKYLHHAHLDRIDHGFFDERQQLAMGNTWAMNRGLAEPEQARTIIDEYRRRHEATGDAFPWWSLQPGYPDALGYFKRPYLRQGGYANGGLMPWVGGELCRAAFRFGRAAYGVELLRAYAEHLRRTGGAQVWYWPDGEPGFRTMNEVRYASWGMAEWMNALLEGLAGVRDVSGQFEKIELAPCWLAASIHDVRVVLRYAASKAYFAYTLRADENTRSINLDITGSGKNLRVRLPKPADWESITVNINGRPVAWKAGRGEDAGMMCFCVDIN